MAAAAGAGVNAPPGFAEVFGAPPGAGQGAQIPVGYPGVQTDQGPVREAWYQLTNQQLMELCNQAGGNGDFS